VCCITIIDIIIQTNYTNDAYITISIPNTTECAALSDRVGELQELLEGAEERYNTITL
jgi:hypothetical protein